jgi:hypothetical protein
MGFLDRVKEMATDGLEKTKELANDGLEKGQELAKTQQLKQELKKLEAQLDDAYAAHGRKAFEAAEAGALSADSLHPEAQAIRDAKAATEAKQAEIEALGATEEPAAEAVAPEPPVTPAP